jgi:hypothetical protein
MLAVGIGVAAGGCATSGTLPHDMSAAAHEEAAAAAPEANIGNEHLAAARTLRATEGSTCAGMPERVRDTTPYFRAEDVESVEPLYEPTGKAGRVLRGAVLRVRPTAGVSAEWLQRSIECHAAHVATLGYSSKGMGECPLALKDIEVTVTSGGNSFVVHMRSRDWATANEVLRRARALASTTAN